MRTQILSTARLQLTETRRRSRTSFVEKPLIRCRCISRTLMIFLLAGPSDSKSMMRCRKGWPGALPYIVSTFQRRGAPQTVQIVKADSLWRKSWEQLVEFGLAVRCRDSPPMTLMALLDSLKFTELNDILRASSPDPLDAKQKPWMPLLG